jgi:hypothetical protein
VGGSFWWVRHPWRGDLGATLDEARQVAFTALPAAERAAADTPTSDLLRRLDVDPDQRRRWRRWLETAPAATRYVLARHPGGMGTVLDVDHVERPPRPTRPPPVDVPAGTRILVPPRAGPRGHPPRQGRGVRGVLRDRLAVGLGGGARGLVGRPPGRLRRGRGRAGRRRRRPVRGHRGLRGVGGGAPDPSPARIGCSSVRSATDAQSGVVPARAAVGAQELPEEPVHRVRGVVLHEVGRVGQELQADVVAELGGEGRPSGRRAPDPARRTRSAWAP